MHNATVLLLPGLGGSGPDHWQTHWEKAFGFERVVQQDWDTPRVEDWVARLQQRIEADSCPKILVAHSLSCALVAHWAHAHHGPVIAALLVAPSDVEAQNYPVGPVGFAPMRRDGLAFPSMVVASDNDPYVPLVHGRQSARSWNSEYVLLGSCGHIGSDAKLGLWPAGQQLLRRLASDHAIPGLRNLDP
jgi:uncharacterized protein